MSLNTRVVVTGLGSVSAIGLDENAMWQNMLAGKTGLGTIKSIDTSECKTHIGGEVNTDELSAALKARQISPSDRNIDMVMLASAAALEQAGFIPGASPLHAATIAGTCLGSSGAMYASLFSLYEKGLRGVRPSTAPRCMGNAISSQLSIRFKLTGPNYIIVSACASSTTAAGTALRMIRDGHIDKVLCVGTDASFDPFTFYAWNNLGVMSKNPDPQTACRPFDAARDGCILGEGAGAIFMESLESALSRGARIRGEICGFGESSDADHITRPNAEGQANAMKMALGSAHMTPPEIGFINTHGTATRANDTCESQSIRLVFGSTADNIPVSANKSFFGHLLGASGIVETIASLMSLESQKLPPNPNLENIDPECNLSLVGRQAVDIRASAAIKNSFGFGGNNAVLVLKRWNG